jgi:hypothetical protein
MYSRPLELSGDTKVIDLINDRSETTFSKDVSNLVSLGLDLSNLEHSFFADCYMKFQADPSFCKDGILNSNSTVVSLPPGGAYPPRASIIKQMPRKLRKIFHLLKGSAQVSNTSNKHLNLKLGGGLSF